MGSWPSFRLGFNKITCLTIFGSSRVIKVRIKVRLL